jgi:hypothetical protein
VGSSTHPPHFCGFHHTLRSPGTVPSYRCNLIASFCEFHCILTVQISFPTWIHSFLWLTPHATQPKALFPIGFTLLEKRANSVLLHIFLPVTGIKFCGMYKYLNSNFAKIGHIRTFLKLFLKDKFASNGSKYWKTYLINFNTLKFSQKNCNFNRCTLTCTLSFTIFLNGLVAVLISTCTYFGIFVSCTAYFPL